MGREACSSFFVLQEMAFTKVEVKFRTQDNEWAGGSFSKHNNHRHGTCKEQIQGAMKSSKKQM
jgi:hypothetical protein